MVIVCKLSEILRSSTCIKLCKGLFVLCYTNLIQLLPKRETEGLFLQTSTPCDKGLKLFHVSFIVELLSRHIFFKLDLSLHQVRLFWIDRLALRGPGAFHFFALIMLAEEDPVPILLIFTHLVKLVLERVFCRISGRFRGILFIINHIEWVFTGCDRSFTMLSRIINFLKAVATLTKQTNCQHRLSTMFFEIRIENIVFFKILSNFLFSTRS